MKSFKAFLLAEDKINLKQVAWYEKILEHIKARYIPLTKPMLTRILGADSIRRVTCFHICNEEYARQVITSLQGSKKSLSVSPHVETEIASSGVQGGGGAVLKLEGTLLASATMDVMSKPDPSGTRWVSLDSLYYAKVIPSKAKAPNIEGYLQNTLKGRDFFNDVNDLCSASVTAHEAWTAKAQLMSAEEYNKGVYRNIKTFFDEIEKVMKEYVDFLRVVLFSFPIEAFTHGVSDRSEWREAVVNEVRVLKVGLWKFTRGGGYSASAGMFRKGSVGLAELCSKRSIKCVRLPHDDFPDVFTSCHSRKTWSTLDPITPEVEAWFDIPTETLTQFAKE